LDADVGTLVLRGALSATLRAGEDATVAPLLTWRGLQASDARIAPLGLPGAGCTAGAAVNYNPFAAVDDGSCVAGAAATLTVVANAADAGYAFDGSGLHLDSGQFSGGALAPGEVHSFNLTLRCGVSYNARLWGDASATLIAEADATPLWSASSEPGGAAVDARLTAPASAPACAAAAAAAGADAAPLTRGATVALSAAAAPAAGSWFTFGVWSLNGALASDAAPVLPPARFATANASAFTLPALPPGLYYIEYYGNLSGTVSLLTPPPVRAAALQNATTVDAVFDAGADDAAAAAAAGNASAPLLVFSAAAQEAAVAAGGSASGWGVPWSSLSSADAYGAALPGGARRAYFAVPSRAGAAARAPLSRAQGGVTGTAADGDAAAWISADAALAAAAAAAAAADAGAPAVSVQPLRLAILAGMAAPPPSLGRIVSGVHALTPLRPSRLAAPVTVAIPYDVYDADNAPAVSPEDASGLAVLRASDAAGADWRVLPNALFLGGVAVVSVDATGVLAVAFRAALAALWPPYGSLGGGVTLSLAGAMLAPPGRFAACRIGGDVYAHATTAPQWSSSSLLPRAHVACTLPPALVAGWVSIEFADGLTLSSTRSGARFLYISPPRIARVAPVSTAFVRDASHGALLWLSGDRLAPPHGAATAPWVCALSGGSDGNLADAVAVSSALVVCEAPRAVAPGAATLRLRPRAPTERAAFPEGRHGGGALSYEPPLQAGPARAATLGNTASADADAMPLSRPWPHGGGLLLLPLSGGPAPGARAAAALRIGTVLLAARDAAAGGGVVAVAPAGGPRPGSATVGVPIALAGAPGAPDTFAGTLVSVRKSAACAALLVRIANIVFSVSLPADTSAPVFPRFAFPFPSCRRRRLMAWRRTRPPSRCAPARPCFSLLPRAQCHRHRRRRCGCCARWMASSLPQRCQQHHAEALAHGAARWHPQASASHR
jgi:hypothetical protein